MTANDVIKQLKSMKNAKNVAGMALFGIKSANILGISVVEIRKIAKEFLKSHKTELPYRHEVADELWRSGIHEARILAAFIDTPALVTEAQMDSWVQGFDSWDIVDQTCGALFDKTPFAYKKAVAWAKRDEEFVRRAGFALMAWLAVHDKKADDEAFIKFLPIIEKYSTDERNFVRKAVNWALRQIGKRNPNLKKEALRVSEKLKNSPDKTARWIGSDAYRELSNR